MNEEEVLSISHFLRQVVPGDCGFYVEQPVPVSGCAAGWNIGFCFQNAMSVWGGKDRSTPEDKGGPTPRKARNTMHRSLKRDLNTTGSQ